MFNMKCKNIECENETNGKNIYCSLSCRNIYVNKHLRNYDKYSDTIKEKNNLKEIEYLKSPKTCKCGEIIPFSKITNKYCNHSCVAKFTNSEKDYSLRSDNIRKGIHKYLIDNNIKDEDKIGLNDLICKGCKNK